MANDPYETINLAGFDTHRTAADAMKERLLRRMVEASEALPTIKSAPTRHSMQWRVTEAEARQ